MEDINVKARKAAYLSGHREVGMVMIYNAGFWMNPAQEVIEGRQKLIECEDSYKYNITDDDWTPPDVGAIQKQMLDALSEIIENSGVCIERTKFMTFIWDGSEINRGYVANMIKKQVSKSPMQSIDIFNDFMEHVGLDDKKIDVDGIRWL